MDSGVFDEVGGLHEIPEALHHVRGEPGVVAHGGEEFLGGLLRGSDGVCPFNIGADNHGELKVELLDVVPGDQVLGDQFGQFKQSPFPRRHPVELDGAADFTEEAPGAIAEGGQAQQGGGIAEEPFEAGIDPEGAAGLADGLAGIARDEGLGGQHDGLGGEPLLGAGLGITPCHRHGRDPVFL